MLERIVIAYSCLFVWGFSSHSRMFHSYGDVTIAGAVNFYSMFGIHGHRAVRVLEQDRLTVRRDFRLYWSSPRTRDTCFRALSCGAVTTYLTT